MHASTTCTQFSCHMIYLCYSCSGCYFNYEYGFDYERIPDLSCPEVRSKLIPRIYISRADSAQPNFSPDKNFSHSFALQKYSSGIFFHPCGKDHYRLHVHVIINIYRTKKKIVGQNFAPEQGAKKVKIFSRQISGYRFIYMVSEVLHYVTVYAS